MKVKRFINNEVLCTSFMHRKSPFRSMVFFMCTFLDFCTAEPGIHGSVAAFVLETAGPNAFREARDACRS